MNYYSTSVTNLIEELKRLPGIGSNGGKHKEHIAKQRSWLSRGRFFVAQIAVPATYVLYPIARSA